MSPHLQSRLAVGAVVATTLLALGACADDGASDRTGASTAGEVAEAPTEGANNTLTRLGTEDVDSAHEAERPPTVAVISTGNVALEADDVADARFDVQRIVDDLRGQVSEEETSTGDDGRAETTRMVLRVPSDSFTEAMRDLEKVGELQSSSAGSEDVTTQVIDNDVRIRAQERALERMEALLAQAASLREVISIESQLTRRQAELDSLKSTQAYLRDQTTLSTITVSIERSAEAKEQGKDEPTGFLGGLERGWDGLVAASIGLFTLLGLVLPFAVVLVLLGVPLLLALRGVRRRRPVSPSEPAPSGSG